MISLFTAQTYCAIFIVLIALITITVEILFLNCFGKTYSIFNLHLKLISVLIDFSLLLHKVSCCLNLFIVAAKYCEVAYRRTRHIPSGRDRASGEESCFSFRGCKKMSWCMPPVNRFYVSDCCNGAYTWLTLLK